MYFFYYLLTSVSAKKKNFLMCRMYILQQRKSFHKTVVTRPTVFSWLPSYCENIHLDIHTTSFIPDKTVPHRVRICLATLNTCYTLSNTLLKFANFFIPLFITGYWAISKYSVTCYVFLIDMVSFLDMFFVNA